MAGVGERPRRQNEDFRRLSEPLNLPAVMTVPADRVGRFKQVQGYLDSNPISDQPPELRAGVSKFTGEEFKYEREDVEPPETVFFRGSDSAVLNAQSSVAFVGTATPSSSSVRLAEFLAAAAAESGSLVVSGGVYGIDQSAHYGALNAGGATVAVIASNPEDGLHPFIPRRKYLEDGILRSGGVLSETQEHNHSLEERKGFLEKRDRIIGALSDAFVVVECRKPEGGKGSASVEGAQKARLMGKKVYAVDWSMFENLYHRPVTEGNQYLIDQGIAEPFPTEAVKSMDDPQEMSRIKREFQEMIRK